MRFIYYFIRLYELVKIGLPLIYSIRFAYRLAKYDEEHGFVRANKK